MSLPHIKYFKFYIGKEKIANKCSREIAGDHQKIKEWFQDKIWVISAKGYRAWEHKWGSLVIDTCSQLHAEWILAASRKDNGGAGLTSVRALGKQVIKPGADCTIEISTKGNLRLVNGHSHQASEA
jgi:hypothetical protein